MIVAGTLGVMQDGIRLSETALKDMFLYAGEGGRFDPDSLAEFDPGRTNLIAITEFEDGARYVRDGFHRVLSAYCARHTPVLYDGEYFIEHLTYQRMMQANLAVGYFTPFDPRTEVRLADFGDFRNEVLAMIGRKEDPMDFIQANRTRYCCPRRKIHDSIQVFCWQRFKFEASKINEKNFQTAALLVPLPDIRAMGGVNAGLV